MPENTEDGQFERQMLPGAALPINFAAHRKARGASHQQGGFPRRGALSLQELPPRLRRFKETSILRSRIFGTSDWEKRGGSTWSSGQGMGTRTILGNPLRISRNVLRFCSGSTRGRDCPQPLDVNLSLNLGMVEVMCTLVCQIASEQSRYSSVLHVLFSSSLPLRSGHTAAGNHSRQRVKRTDPGTFLVRGSLSILEIKMRPPAYLGESGGDPKFSFPRGWSRSTNV